MVTDYAVYISHFVRHFFKERQKKKAYTFLLKKTHPNRRCQVLYLKVQQNTIMHLIYAKSYF